MASKYWIKLYHEILEDPKMGTLPDNLWRRTIELFLLAGELDQGGQLPSTTEIAWKLRHDVVTLRDEMSRLCVTGILTAQENDTWLVTRFAERQKADTDKERKRQQREREKRPKYQNSSRNDNENGHEPVTQRDIEADIDSSSSSSSATEKTKEQVAQKLTNYYLACEGARPDLAADYIDEFMMTYPPWDVNYAITEAIKNNAYKLAYIEAICKRRKSGEPDQKQKKPRDQLNGTHPTGKLPPIDKERLKQLEAGEL